MTEDVALIIWAIGIVAWLAIRLPRRRKARKARVIVDRVSLTERLTLSLCIVGLVICPALYALEFWFDGSNYRFQPALAWLGTAIMIVFIALFYLSHKQLDRNWSVTLEVREGHKLVNHGLYAHIRHPMYTSFFLWGIAQALLISDWIAGFAGLASVLVLYLSRINNEEDMMRSQFGSAYDEYCKKTTRLVPRLF